MAKHFITKDIARYYLADKNADLFLDNAEDKELAQETHEELVCNLRDFSFQQFAEEYSDALAVTEIMTELGQKQVVFGQETNDESWLSEDKLREEYNTWLSYKLDKKD